MGKCLIIGLYKNIEWELLVVGGLGYVKKG